MLVDQFTKRLYASPCKSKLAHDVLAAIRNVIEYQTLSRPKILYTHKGLEFTNALVENYLENILKIKHVTTKNPSIKCAIAERTNRTLKSVLVRIADHNNGRYIDQLENAVKGYNSTKHNATGIAPENINPLTIDSVRQQLYTRAAKRRVQQQFGLRTWDSNMASPKHAVGNWVHALNRANTNAFR